MDSSVLTLFSTEEILDRLGRKVATGCLHVFTAKDSANIFFKDGQIVNVTQGQAEGMDILKELQQWNDVRYSWQGDIAAVTTATRPLQLPVQNSLNQQAPPVERPAKPRVALTDSSRVPSASGSLHPVIMIPSRGATTGPIDTGPVPLTVMKTITLSGDARSAQEQHLLKKHGMILVSVEDPNQKLRITRVSSLIGRNPACDIAIAHSSISRQHCLVQISDRGIHLKDLDTTNGCKVNGVPLKEGFLNEGDKLTIGHLNFMLEKA